MTHVYNEIEPFAVEWLENLQLQDQIPVGRIYDRPIQELRREHLRGVTQFHTFAGIGGWPLALRLAGWPEGREVWTGSCPCPPFSSAGKKFRCPQCQERNLVPCPRRTGFFICADCGHAWLADARHLWPEFWRLIAECRPSVVMGEQVAGQDGLTWLAGVRASLEILGYRFRAADLCAAGVGAPHIRQRLYWVADTLGANVNVGKKTEREGQPTRRGSPSRLADDNGPRLQGQGYAREEGGAVPLRSSTQDGWLADTGCIDIFSEGHRASSAAAGVQGAHGERQRLWPESESVDGDGIFGLADSDLSFENGRPSVREQSICQPGHGNSQGLEHSSSLGRLKRGPQSGWWGLASRCGSDGKWRRIEPGIEPLAHGVSRRMDKLRGYGNAIVPPLAAEFIRAYMDSLIS